MEFGDLQASPGGPELWGGGSLYTSRLLLLVTSEPWGYKDPHQTQQSQRRGSGTSFHTFPSNKRHEGFSRDLYLGVMCLLQGPRPTQGPLITSPSIETSIYGDPHS